MTTNHNQIRSNDPLVKRKELKQRLQISYTTLWRCVQRGELPPPLKLGGSAYWPESEIQELLNRMVAKRNIQLSGTAPAH